MADDNKTPYEVLGVAKTASDAEIKKAYRKLAKELHPDLTGGDAAKADRFKAVSAAYDLLRDAEKRRRYDAGEIDASGQERPQEQYYRQYAENDPSGRYEYEGGFDDLGDLFKNAFRGGGRSRGGFSAGFGEDFSHMKMRGQDLHFHMEISFREAVEGGKKAVTLPEAGRLEITIPAGIEDGQTLRLAGKGGPGANGGAPGDALITISVAEDPVFTRDGDDIHMDLPVSIDEAVLGGPVEVPLPGGRVRLKVPANSSSGRVMRLRGKGVVRANGRAGDLLVTLKVVLPQTEDPALAEAIRKWRAEHSYDARANWEGNRK
ncbi:DnaJ C-terminal domain-containing protein [Paenirhodobacter populi]|uniref:J domain-containing protein n=1 Tax=Paenirhodobacter populi TaxID=2306993 RepID=A0A443J1Y3_9RHOB|nr:DnaJ C-terminal domain-containing protein [Sinirhodobacter populi]RWR14484.1 J domain-containing protein [Sinirhodobacter populi]